MEKRITDTPVLQTAQSVLIKMASGVRGSWNRNQIIFIERTWRFETIVACAWMACRRCFIRYFSRLFF